MNYHIQYNKPIKNDICVAFAFFNPCGYVRPLQNLTFFENKLRLANIPYFSAEMIIGDQMPMLSNPTCVYRSKSHLFYKEELFNRLVTFIPEQYTKIMFLDSDIIFNCVDWVDRLSDILDTKDIVQVFERICYLDLTYNENYWVNASTVDYNTNSSGFGWAMTRSFFSQIGGFFDRCTLGSGDSIFFHAIVNTVVKKYPIIEGFINEYREKIAALNPKWGFLPDVNIYHLTHGSRRDRKYVDRYAILTKSNYTWDSLFYKNEDGFWELRDESINQEFLEYFKSRNEDSISSFIKPTAPSTNIDTKSYTKEPVDAPPKKLPEQSLQNLPTPIRSVQATVNMNQYKYRPQPQHRPVYSQARPVEAIVKPRYLAPQINIQQAIHTTAGVSHAAAAKSIQKRVSIRNTVVYNRTPVVSSRPSNSDDDYSD